MCPNARPVRPGHGPSSTLARAVRAAVVAAIAVAVVLGTAAPASAHAILLRTEPSSQTTVQTPPTAIKLHFSEAVEATFGAIRVFDVNGRRVDSGKLTRADGNREVDVPVSKLGDGTYTLTWRVVSSDGHPVDGGFSFYVGAPSSISAVVVAPDANSSTVVGVGYGVVRFVWFAGLLALIGMIVTRRWVWTPAVRAGDLADSPAADGYRRRFALGLHAAWMALAAAGLLTLVFQGARGSGLALVSSARPEVLGEVLSTAFGRLWIFQAIITAVMAVPVFAVARNRRLAGVEPGEWANVLLGLAAGLCVAAGFSGHARSLSHPAVGVTSIALHLLAVGVWVGGLGALVAIAGPAWRTVPAEGRPSLLLGVITRFSRIAVGAVAVLVATGVLNAILDLGSIADLWRTRYGQVIMAKVFLLGIALVLAARHRWTTPRRLAPTADDQPDDDRQIRAVVSFDRSAALELAVLVAAVGLAATLVALVPGRALAQAANGPVNLERRAGPYTVQLFIDPTAIGANELHVTFVDSDGLGAAGVTNARVLVGLAGTDPLLVPTRLISPGHFVGDTTLTDPGTYELQVSAGPGVGDAATFRFRLRGHAPAAPQAPTHAGIHSPSHPANHTSTKDTTRP